MVRKGLHSLPALAIAIMLLVGSAVAVTAQSRERIEHWRIENQELKATDDPRAAEAHAIFQRLVQVAGKRPGVVPRLFIAASDPCDLALPIALPDGWVVLSKSVLDICYQDPARGEDRLAFMLAYEIAHQLNDNFWHMQFFQALQASKAHTPVAQEVLDEMRRSAGTREHVLGPELQADERGIIYAAMAGFKPQSIVAGDHSVNFFADWIRALYPRRLGGASPDQLLPTPQERAETLRAHLRRVANRTALFQIGLWFYYAGDYLQAIRAFEDFRSFFPGREVYHNLAASHHQLALRVYQARQPDLPVFPFQLSLAVDPMTRAGWIYLEGPRRGRSAAAGDPALVFRHHLDEAIAFYREALTHDPSYTPAAINLGCALIVRGLDAEAHGLNADFSEAVTTLLRAIERTPNSPEILNNLGVALWYMDQREQANDQLARARTLAPAYAAPVFNLGQLAHTEQRQAEARQYWQAYEQLAPRPSARISAAKPGTESVMGVAVGQIEDRLPQYWDKPARSVFQVEKRTLAMATYPAGVLTLSQDGEIRMIMVREGFRGISATGIRVGSEAREVLSRQGSPSRRLELTQGQSWAYDDRRIAFQLRDGRVVSWLLF